MSKARMFNYCIGRPWSTRETVRPGAIATYAQGAVVFFGTLKEARERRKEINGVSGEEYYIYELVQVPEKPQPRKSQLSARALKAESKRVIAGIRRRIKKASGGRGGGRQPAPLNYRRY